MMNYQKFTKVRTGWAWRWSSLASAPSLTGRTSGCKVNRSVVDIEVNRSSIGDQEVSLRLWGQKGSIIFEVNNNRSVWSQQSMVHWWSFCLCVCVCFLIVFFCHSDHPVHGLGMFVPVFRIQANFPINKCYWPFQIFEISL